jgi:hypothetical protein
MSDPSPEAVLAEIAGHLQRLGKRFALVGGLGVSVRSTVRFTRDVDVAVAVHDDPEAEDLVRDLRSSGYTVRALVEQEATHRLATVRLASPLGLTVDLIFASCGIEPEIVDRATTVEVESVGAVPVARAEELLAMKVLSMTEHRLQDAIDAVNLVAFNQDLDLGSVREGLALIKARGCDRSQDLDAKLAAILRRLGS